MAATPKKMKALVLTGANEFEIREVITPEPGPGEVLARVEAVAICGTDPKIIAGQFAGLWPKSYPAIIGHEWAGTIVGLGSETSRCSLGDRVAGEPHKGCGFCRNCLTGRYTICENYGNLASGHRHYGFTAPGAYAGFIACSERTVHRIPDNISFEEATNVDTAGTALHAAKRGRVAPGDDVAIFGPGAVGLLCLQFARAMGAGRVFVIGGRNRLALAETLGAVPLDRDGSDPVEEIRKRTSGKGVHVAIDCAGTAESVQKAVAVTRKGGRVVLAGLPPGPVSLPIPQIVLDEKDLLGVRADPNTCEEAIPLLASGAVKIKPMITHVFALEDFRQALKVFSERLEGAIKVIVKP
jgi:L-iditol 2-dehydrogenase